MSMLILIDSHAVAQPIESPREISTRWSSWARAEYRRQQRLIAALLAGSTTVKIPPKFVPRTLSDLLRVDWHPGRQTSRYRYVSRGRHGRFSDRWFTCIPGIPKRPGETPEGYETEEETALQVLRMFGECWPEDGAQL